MDKNNITNTMTSTDTSDKEALLHSNENCTEDTSADLLLSPGSLCADGIFGDSTILPRLGDHYQVEIPSLMEESEYLDLRHRQINTEDTLGVNFYLRIGLAIPIMWVNRVGYHIKPEQEEFSGTAFAADRARSVSTIDNQEDWLGYKGSALTGHSSANLSSDNSDPHGSACNVETSHDLLGCIKESTGSKFQRYMTLDEQINTNCCSSRSRETNIPLPASSLSSWSDAESQGFLLGLYIFGKNLNQVKKFLESKEMGDVLSFYYGKFYRSDTYRRWSECRKIRSRRCIYGQRIFTGWRQQEVLSRILPSTSKEIQDTILEAAKNFNEGRASFEEFVFALKAMVGMKALVEAIGIGKGKLDLTGILLDPVRVNQVMPTRPEIPVGKACSSLTSGDIIKFLTGDFRLSKAKSNDLFWEAVWPRLLARGWHSEQPKDLGSAGSKSALVFLIPGVRKFSRKKLVKGDHYFDSVSDILNKVASDPMLLELEVEGTKGNSNFKVERQQDTNSRSDQNGRLDHQRTCYLRPKLSNCNSEFMKFTVVDTSLVQGEEMLKVRELRSLPMDAACSYSPSDHLRENNSDSSAMQSDSTDISLNDLGPTCPLKRNEMDPARWDEAYTKKKKISGKKKKVIEPQASSQLLLEGKESEKCTPEEGLEVGPTENQPDVEAKVASPEPEPEPRKKKRADLGVEDEGLEVGQTMQGCPIPKEKGQEVVPKKRRRLVLRDSSHGATGPLPSSSLVGEGSVAGNDALPPRPPRASSSARPPPTTERGSGSSSGEKRGVADFKGMDPMIAALAKDWRGHPGILMSRSRARMAGSALPTLPDSDFLHQVSAREIAEVLMIHSTRTAVLSAGLVGKMGHIDQREKEAASWKGKVKKMEEERDEMCHLLEEEKLRGKDREKAMQSELDRVKSELEKTQAALREAVVAKEAAVSASQTDRETSEKLASRVDELGSELSRKKDELAVKNSDVDQLISELGLTRAELAQKAETLDLLQPKVKWLESKEHQREVILSYFDKEAFVLYSNCIHRMGFDHCLKLLRDTPLEGLNLERVLPRGVISEADLAYHKAADAAKTSTWAEMHKEKFLPLDFEEVDIWVNRVKKAVTAAVAGLPPPTDASSDEDDDEEEEEREVASND